MVETFFKTLKITVIYSILLIIVHYAGFYLAPLLKLNYNGILILALINLVATGIAGYMAASSAISMPESKKKYFLTNVGTSVGGMTIVLSILVNYFIPDLPETKMAIGLIIAAGLGGYIVERKYISTKFLGM